jgi:hypothetical protein
MGAPDDGSQTAGTDVTELRATITVAVESVDPCETIGEEVQSTLPENPLEGQRLSVGIRTTGVVASDAFMVTVVIASLSRPSTLDALSGSSSSNGALDVLGVGDCVHDGVRDWLPETD